MADPNQAPPVPLDPQAVINAFQAINNVLTQLETRLTALGNAGAGAAAIGTHVDPVFQAAPFDLSSRAGINAYTQASSKLSETWDGSVNKFPSFLIALRERAQESNWMAPLPQGILTITSVTDPSGATTHDLITEYQSITDADIQQAFMARTDNRAKQNSTTMYRAIKQSIDGDLHTTLFQSDVLTTPTAEDGVALFHQLTKFTAIASLQLYTISLRKLLEFQPADYDFNIPTINKQLNHLFVLSTTKTRKIPSVERIHHTLTVYERIQQPEVWAQWVRHQFDEFQAGRITNIVDFQNSAVLKYNTVATKYTKFPGSSTTIQEDVVAMLSKRKVGTDKPSDKTNDPDESNKRSRSLPPFARHYRVSNEPEAALYKVGDTKAHQGTTWYFCDCPHHRGKIKWHTYSAESCRTRKSWLANKAKPAANVAMAPPPDTVDTSSISSKGTSVSTTTGPSTTSASPDLAALLAAALNLAGSDSVTKDFIADALTSLR